MAFFDNLTASLKQKWLNFFQTNRGWIIRQMEVESVYTPDGGRRPPSYLILGVVSAIEPQLAELMLPFVKLNSDVDALIDALELNFDPDLVLGNRLNQQALPQAPKEMAASDEATSTVVLSADEVNALTDISFDDDIADETDGVETGNIALGDEFGNVLLDDWEQETGSQSEQTGEENFLEDQKQSEDEISRLFPNF